MLWIRRFTAFFVCTGWVTKRKNRYLPKVNTQARYNAHIMERVKVGIDSEKLHISSELLRALAHPLRLKILEFIDRNPAINVNKIYNSLRLEQSITSQHLRILRDSGLVDADRKGKYVYYELNYELIQRSVLAIGRYHEASRKKK
jgi:DNA-binding transcriptional ArsR family regulator